eukprot:TRINITY_DN4852_c0_g4_i1.p2 TRINITY_DN4852_c0_g4~~TRINITY_DN4852_c0_g4_i1.p2  ORF type:complete len:135 (-),score=54.36 TRINITY_DN4852_c0_g4_i1:92-457(-)
MASSKNMLYVGGLAEDVTEANLTAVFQPFGDITTVQIPIDPNSKKHRGFGFVTFESDDDAREAMENLNDAELYGRVLKINIAKPLKLGEKSRAIWADRDEYEAKKADGATDDAPPAASDDS